MATEKIKLDNFFAMPAPLGIPFVLAKISQCVQQFKKVIFRRTNGSYRNLNKKRYIDFNFLCKFMLLIIMGDFGRHF